MASKSTNESVYSVRESAIQELTQGHALAKQLRSQLEQPVSDDARLESVTNLSDRVLKTLTVTLSLVRSMINGRRGVKRSQKEEKKSRKQSDSSSIVTVEQQKISVHQRYRATKQAVRHEDATAAVMMTTTIHTPQLILESPQEEPDFRVNDVISSAATTNPDLVQVSSIESMGMEEFEALTTMLDIDNMEGLLNSLLDK